ncbi:MAG TPA: hypothetical protein VGF67_32290 [Ktedonobacteraceae bacterium]|jgi:hypothetical protein
MKKLVLAFLILCLVGVCISGCSTNAVKSTTVCVGTVIVAGVVTYFTEGLTASDFTLAIATPCIEMAYDLFTSSAVSGTLHPSSTSRSTARQPNVTLSERYAFQKVATGQVYSILLNNCSSTLPTLSIHRQVAVKFFLKYVMAVVGLDNNVSLYTAKPAGKSATAMVADAVSTKYSDVLSRATATIHQTIDVVIAPHTKVALVLQMTQPYWYGVARFTQSNTDYYLPWFFAVSSQQTGHWQSHVQKC